MRATITECVRVSVPRTRVITITLRGVYRRALPRELSFSAADPRAANQLLPIIIGYSFGRARFESRFVFLLVQRIHLKRQEATGTLD